MSLFNDWKSFGVAMMFLCVGLIAGQILTNEQAARERALGMCEVCQSNLGIMVDNFNVLANQCKIANPFKNSTIASLNSTLIDSKSSN